MALKIEELFTSASRGARARMTPDRRGLYVATFGADALAELLIAGCPVAYNEINDEWVPYTQPSDASIVTLTRDAGAGDGGTMELIIDGLGISLDWDEDTAGVLAKVNAVLEDAEKPYVVTVANSGSGTDLGTSGNVQTITFGEGAGSPTVSVDTVGLTDGGVSEPSGIALVISDAGTSLEGSNKIRGFVFEDSIQIDASDEVLGVIMVKGEAERNDANTAAVRALLRGSPSEAELDLALGKPAVRDAGIFVRGLSTVH